MTATVTWGPFHQSQSIKSPRWDLWHGHVVLAAPMGRIDFNETFFSAEKPASLNIVHSDKSKAVLPGTNLIIRNRWNVNFPTGNDRSNSLIATFCSVQRFLNERKNWKLFLFLKNKWKMVLLTNNRWYIDWEWLHESERNTRVHCVHWRWQGNSPIGGSPLMRTGPIEKKFKRIISFFPLLSSTPSFFTEMFPLAGEQIILIGFIHSIFCVCVSVNGTRKKTATFGRVPMTTNCLRPRRFIALGTTGFPWTYEWMKLGTLLKVEQRCWLFQFIHFSFQKIAVKRSEIGKSPTAGTWVNYD